MSAAAPSVRESSLDASYAEAFGQFRAARSRPILRTVYLIAGGIPLAYFIGDLWMGARVTALVVAVRLAFLAVWAVLLWATFMRTPRLPIVLSYPLFTAAGVTAACLIEAWVHPRVEYILATTLMFLVGLVVSQERPWLVALCGALSALLVGVLLPLAPSGSAAFEHALFLHIVWAVVATLAARAVDALNRRLFDTEQRLTAALHSNRELLAREAEARRELEWQAQHDPLSAALNRRAFYQRAAPLFAAAKASGRPLSVAILDLDRFKRINDEHGHAAGDVALQAAADACRAELEASALLARFGGEEFVLLWPELSGDVAAACAENLRRRIAELAIVLPDGALLQFTASIGVAALEPSVPTLDALIANADRALYVAKKAGRDRVEVASRE